MYDIAWMSYTKILAETRDHWFYKREEKFIWDKEHDILIKKIYNHWVANTYEGFKRHRLTNRANRASPRSSKYTGGSATFIKMKHRLSLDRKAILVETFKYTHTMKANKEKFVDEWSAAHHRLEAATQQSQLPSGDAPASSDASVLDPVRVWRETASDPHKNCVFGLGSFFTSGLCTSALATSSTSASATFPSNLKEVVELREDLQKLTKELH
ncbi:hypothetical protein Ahy_B07g086252 [Arachis hypogaea]|uniref:Uncharacterized protein n=1 Tax=Arachis hypogaea TaxID=3818 RepID=A0A444Y990_ARAHY|nr:hypothetical protein Ahy_B07g086252 [Arachis hypogaea]